MFPFSEWYLNYNVSTLLSFSCNWIYQIKRSEIVVKNVIPGVDYSIAPTGCPLDIVVFVSFSGRKYQMYFFWKISILYTALRELFSHILSIPGLVSSFSTDYSSLCSLPRWNISYTLLPNFSRRNGLSVAYKDKIWYTSP